MKCRNSRSIHSTGQTKIYIKYISAICAVQLYNIYNFIYLFCVFCILYFFCIFSSHSSLIHCDIHAFIRQYSFAQSLPIQSHLTSTIQHRHNMTEQNRTTLPSPHLTHLPNLMSISTYGYPNTQSHVRQYLVHNYNIITSPN